MTLISSSGLTFRNLFRIEEHPTCVMDVVAPVRPIVMLKQDRFKRLLKIIECHPHQQSRLLRQKERDRMKRFPLGENKRIEKIIDPTPGTILEESATFSLCILSLSFCLYSSTPQPFR